MPRLRWAGLLLLLVLAAACEAASARMLVAYFSAPGNVQRRAKVRETCKLRGIGTTVKFFVGRPLTDFTFGKGQGQRAAPEEIAMTKALREEQEKYGDLVACPMRDHYRELSDKMVCIADEALRMRANLLLKIDDDMCPRMEQIHKAAAMAGGKPLYAGRYLFQGTEYEVMAGANGTIAPFMSGVVFLLNRQALRLMFRRNRFDTILGFAEYGTTSDDANVGKWVARTHVPFSMPVLELGYPID